MRAKIWRNRKTRRCAVAVRLHGERVTLAGWPEYLVGRWFTSIKNLAFLNNWERADFLADEHGYLRPDPPKHKGQLGQ
jgi:hypothetical protein